MNSDITTPIKIRVKMLSQGMTQVSLARKLGISRQSLNRYLRYEADLKLSVLLRIAKALNVDPQKLI